MTETRAAGAAVGLSKDGSRGTATGLAGLQRLLGTGVHADATTHTALHVQAQPGFPITLEPVDGALGAQAGAEGASVAALGVELHGPEPAADTPRGKTLQGGTAGVGFRWWCRAQQRGRAGQQPGEEAPTWWLCCQSLIRRHEGNRCGPGTLQHAIHRVNTFREPDGGTPWACTAIACAHNQAPQAIPLQTEQPCLGEGMGTG